MDKKDRPDPLPAFIAESTLGTLAKWLRLAGLDTVYVTGTPNPGGLKQKAKIQKRILLTRTHAVMEKLDPSAGLFISYNDPMDQARQVMRAKNITRKDLSPLSICSCCNRLLDPVFKEDLAGRVPEYVLLHHDRFLTCRECRRVYWSGSHVARALERIDQWFTM